MKLIWAISRLSGGGAEHVLMQLANFSYEKNIQTELFITNQYSSEENMSGLNKNIPVTFLQDRMQEKKKMNKSVFVLCKCFELAGLSVPNSLARLSFLQLYGGHVNVTYDYLQENKGAVIVSFLQPTSEILMMAKAKGANNPLIVSERSDPAKFMKSRYARYFLNTYYPDIQGMVFQTPDAMSAYPDSCGKKGIVIPNPIPKELPDIYLGTRKKKIVNFCRLSKQKNPMLLLAAFERFANQHPDYQLEFIGNGELRDGILNYIAGMKHGDRVSVLPHRNNLHELIKEYAMFISSSDWEGMSNSMLEAMAIGIPTICTDCPIGGARYIIDDHINGILVPTNDVDRLVEAMNDVANNSELSNTLSKNGSNLREQLSIESIGNQWLSYISERCGS